MSIRNIKELDKYCKDNNKYILIEKGKLTGLHPVTPDNPVTGKTTTEEAKELLFQATKVRK